MPTAIQNEASRLFPGDGASGHEEPGCRVTRCRPGRQSPSALIAQETSRLWSTASSVSAVEGASRQAVRLAKEVLSSRGFQPSPSPAEVVIFLKARRTLAASSGVPTEELNTRSRSCQSSPASSRCSACRPCAAAMRRLRVRAAARALGLLGIGIAVRADRTPHGDVRRHGRNREPDLRRGRHVATSAPCLLGPDPGQQARHHVGAERRPVGGAISVMA